MNIFILIIIGAFVILGLTWIIIEIISTKQINDLNKCYRLSSQEEQYRCVDNVVRSWGEKSYKSFKECLAGKGICYKCEDHDISVRARRD